MVCIAFIRSESVSYLYINFTGTDCEARSAHVLMVHSVFLTRVLSRVECSISIFACQMLTLRCVIECLRVKIIPTGSTLKNLRDNSPLIMHYFTRLWHTHTPELDLDVLDQVCEGSERDIDPS